MNHDIDTEVDTDTHTDTQNQDSPDRRSAANTRPEDQLDRPEWLGVERWPFAIRRFEHRNQWGEAVDIHYTDEGTGPTLVFVHAGMWSFIWRDAIAALRQNFRCISLDFPATGLSSGGRHDIDIASYPEIVNGLLDHCRVDRATMVVHDLGGAVGVLSAAHRPERISGLLAVNSFGWAPDRFALRAMLRVMGSAAMTGLLGTFRVIPRMSRTAAGVGRNFDAPDRAAFFGPYRSRSRSRDFHRTMRSARRETEAFEEAERALIGPLSHLRVGTVFGEKNDPFGFADRWKSLFPEAERWTVVGGNHFPMCDDPVGFVEHVTDWFGDR